MDEKIIPITTDDHIKNFIKLTEVLNHFIHHNTICNLPEDIILQTALSESVRHNGFFTPETVMHSMKSIVYMLEECKLRKWTDTYPWLTSNRKTPRKVAVVMAGNIPLVGFHDFLCVLMSGNVFIGKLSQSDRFLLPAITQILIQTDARYKDFICFAGDKLQGFDAVIATGSNNTSRYFDYYFEKYPHIIRSHRNSLAVLSGDETREQLQLLGNDIFSYFGLGCRNVSCIFVPEKYDFEEFTSAMQTYSKINEHNKYRNNYDYFKTIFIMNNQPFIDGGFFILKEDLSINSPVAVLNFQRYSCLDAVTSFVESNQEKIQCVVGGLQGRFYTIGYGKAQCPELFDYADNIDTMEFLYKL